MAPFADTNGWQGYSRHSRAFGDHTNRFASAFQRKLVFSQNFFKGLFQSGVVNRVEVCLWISTIFLMEPRNTEQARWFVDEVLPQEQDLRTWLRARFPSIQDVDDLVQEAFTRLLKAHDSGPIVNPRAFLFVVARNLALNQLRHLRYERPQGAEEVDPLSIMDQVNSPPEALALQEEFQHLIQAIQS